jgi:hypothetical protein
MLPPSLCPACAPASSVPSSCPGISCRRRMTSCLCATRKCCAPHVSCSQVQQRRLSPPVSMRPGLGAATAVHGRRRLLCAASAARRHVPVISYHHLPWPHLPRRPAVRTESAAATTQNRRKQLLLQPPPPVAAPQDAAIPAHAAPTQQSRPLPWTQRPHRTEQTAIALPPQNSITLMRPRGK